MMSGMVFHLAPGGRRYLPLLPRGDPAMPRARPEHSVMDITHKPGPYSRS